MTTSTWLITGASSGLGFALAEHILKQGDRVVLAARNLASMQTLAAAFPETALAVSLDVTDPRQRVEALRQAEARFGAIDFLLNNAGIDFVGAVEEQDEADYRKIFEVNFFGAVAMLRLALPAMRARGRGTIVNMSSMDGIASFAVNGFYSASKFALEGVTEALWQEIEPLGLRAVLIEPGSFRTGIGDRTAFSGQKIDDYAATSGAFREAMANIGDDMFPGDPARAASAIFTALKSDSRAHRIILGADAYRNIGAKLEGLRADYEASREIAHATDFQS
ncbi:SDR family NAD(P)-dependent oxidoreductase [Phenylobacterium sp.]|jgi:NAD(P)-dependent dehydrogenase (short-subunit alcohol dehydrogenase family)|uniref:SDR family NAD(P)-dependent oxidoreductase n=1 Tax=Phenylobacterium sp. TaxID=1871053 RepID=UPI002F41A992